MLEGADVGLRRFAANPTYTGVVATTKNATAAAAASSSRISGSRKNLIPLETPDPGNGSATAVDSTLAEG